MKTIEEILESLKENPKTTNEVIWIDADSRKVDIPQKEKIFGVVGDGNAERKYLACKRKPSEDFDFKDAKIKIYYKSVAEDETEHSDIYLVNEKIYNDDYVVFSWLLTESVFPYEGNLYFFVRAEIEEENRIWQSCIAAGYINENFDITLTEPEEIMIRDYVKEMIKELEDKGDYVLSRIPSDYIKLAEHHDIETQTELDAIVKAIFGESVAGTDGKTLNYAELVTIMNKFMRDEIRGNEVKIGGLLRLVNGDIIYTEEKDIDYAINSVCNYLLDRISESGGYKLPMATGRFLGGVKAYEKYEDDTQPVHVDEDGFLWTNKAAVKMANDGALGGVKASQVVRGDSQPVHIDENGFLWTQAGGGGSSGNLPFYNAIDYGVSPSSSDNTDAINSVLDAAYSAGGGTVVLPAGIIKTFPFDMRSKVSVIGQGMFSTTLSFLGTSQSGRPSAVFFPEDAIGCEFAHLALYGNWTAQNGIDCASIGHSGGFGENDYSDALFSNPTDFIKYKSAHLHHLFISKFGYEVDYLMPANTVVGWGIYHHDQSNYCFDMSNIWVYACQNGIKCMGTDSSLTNSYVEHCHFQGLWLQGGNSKYNNLKVIWNGLKWDGSGELFAIDMHEDTQYLSIMNLECQDNYCNDIRLKGIGHEIHCFADGSRDVRKNYKIKCENLRGSILDVRLTNYVGHESDNYKATYDLAMSNCHHNKVNAIIMPNVAKNQGTVDNVNGDTNIIRM